SLNITGPEDAFAQDDVELDGTLYLNGEVRMKDAGPNGDQTIFFYDVAPTNEFFRWTDLAQTFTLSGDLQFDNNSEGGGQTDLRSLGLGFPLHADDDNNNPGVGRSFNLFTAGDTIEQIRMLN